MKKIILVISFLLLNFYLLFITPIPIFAHILATSGSIGAVMHIDPNDDPIASSQTNFYFDFKDKDNKFSLNNCDCKLSIFEEGNRITQVNLVNGTETAIFPEKNVYSVEVTGHSTNGSFDDFRLSYSVRVDKENNNQTNPKSYSSYIIIGVIIFILSAFGIMFTQRKKGGD